MIQDDLERLLGRQAVVSDEVDKHGYLTEWRDRVRGEAAAIVRPASTEQVVEVVRYCADRGYSIVAQGGNTGLCGGAIPTDARTSVLLSLSRMNRILDVRPDDNAMTVEAGCTLAAVQEAAREADRYFPLSLAAEGSATIGGNLATNAGGIHVLRYGTARDLTLGLEVVLADGLVWNGLKTLRKNTAGYDLRQLFIGTEGTLGIITRAVVALHPQPQRVVTAYCAVDGIDAALALFHRLEAELPASLQAFELISEPALGFVLQHIPNTRRPLVTESPYVVLAEFAGGAWADIDEAVVNALGQALEDGAILDVAMASSLAQRDDFWRLRHTISEAQKYEGASLKHDIALPLSKLAAFHAEAAATLEQLCPGIRPCVFGHIGDGNLHYNLSRPSAMSDEAFRATGDTISRAVYDRVEHYGGTVSAEHGIGAFKRDLLDTHLSDVDRSLMTTLKRALDPAGRLNPGKVVAAQALDATVREFRGGAAS